MGRNICVQGGGRSSESIRRGVSYDTASSPSFRRICHMKRIEILDGLRGYFLLFMLINHLILTGGLWLQDVTLGQLMFVEDAQGFVFLSGLLIGLIQYRRMERRGYAGMRASVHHRAWELYLYAMGVILLVFAARAVLPGAAYAFRNWVGFVDLSDPTRLAAIVTMVFQPTFMDILPQYILYLLVAPPLIRWVAEGRWPLVLTLSGLCWLSTQIGADNLLAAPLHMAATAADGQGLRGAFEPLAWQLLFMSGLVLGVLTAQGKIQWEKLLSHKATTLPLIAVAVLAFLLPVRIASAWGWFQGQDFALLNSMTIRTTFGPVYLASFSAAAVLVTWLMVAAPQSPYAVLRRISAVLRGICNFWFLRLLGRHSLQTYAWHVVLIYGVRYIDAQYGAFNLGGRTLIAFICIALLPLPALWRDYGHVLLRSSPKAG
ncbi:hypothetical protein FGG78_27895 [Thioclava sp. BHET1]|nr:hypothetical protein FGG78_27895 [Thioclava sp. BHET1]